MWLAIFFFVTIIGLLLYLDIRKPKNFPPGPKWWPLVGSGPQLEIAKRSTGHLVMATSKLAEEYGPILGLKAGTQKLVVVHGTKAIREFLSSEDLAGRPRGEFFDMRTWGKRRGILLVDETFWQDQRRFILRQLRDFGFGTRNMSTLVEEEAQELVDHIFKSININDSTVFNMDTLFGVHILNTLWKMLAGVRYSKEDSKMLELQDILTELFTNVSMIGAAFSQYPVLKYLAPNLSGYSIYIQAHQQIWDFLNRELESHKSSYNPDDPRDFIDVYLAMLENMDDVPDSFTEQQLMAICMDMFMAGSETTSNTLGFCFMYLTAHPEIQKKAQEEIDAVVGKGRTPTLHDRPNLLYVESIVLEALRMFGGRAFTVPHRALRDTYLDGYFIPKDVLVIANLGDSMLSSNCSYEEPEKFKPERHMKDGKVTTMGDGFIPFGFGKHRCLGETLARANVFLFVAFLLQRFTFSVVPEHPVKFEWRDGVTPGPVPFKARVTPRM